MQLNESTYETIFLLYIDNELSPKERLEVEVFIADNPSYALEMQALKATVLFAENMPYAFKENLKQQEVETSLEDLEKDWDANYATLIKEDMHAITGLSTSFKNTLKKEATKVGIVLKPLGFSQQKFAYAAIAACLMVFLGYQQLTKTPVSDFSAANANVVSWGGFGIVDVDDYEGSIDDIHEKYSKYKYVCYSTASSTKAHPKFRLVFPLTHQVDADKIKHFWFALNKLEGLL